MELKWLKDFLVLSKKRNFRLAARQYNVSQPTFSRRIQALEAWVAAPLIDRCRQAGIDGCGFPALTMPLSSLACIIAKFAKPDGLSKARTDAIYRLQTALYKRPLYAAGHGAIVSALNTATPGAVLVKTGTEGILIAALPKQGLGIVLRIADGNACPRAVALLATLSHSRGEIIGQIRPVSTWLPKQWDACKFINRLFQQLKIAPIGRKQTERLHDAYKILLHTREIFPWEPAHPFHQFRRGADA